MADFMPILRTPFAIRMDVLNEAQAQKNHGQSLARLAERGGLSIDEALAIAESRRWRSVYDGEAVAALVAMQPPTPEEPKCT